MSETGRPLLRVVQGEPSAEELAALLAVIAARNSAARARPALPRTAWNHPTRLVRTPLRSGPGGWRASALPR
ncbi:MAG: acyl-CoA carboxylase subunit epsilon [Sporichthyaceae bacterium]|nr:acyl-CoA carboxylase subunit epsilon [Sporichthyaceae bacterium]